MNPITFNSSEFILHPDRAKEAAKGGPVFITERGRTTHVLLTIEDYQKLADNTPNIVDLLAMADGADGDFTPPRVQGLAKPMQF
jgi:hypothetical protein